MILVKMLFNKPVTRIVSVGSMLAKPGRTKLMCSINSFV